MISDPYRRFFFYLGVLAAGSAEGTVGRHGDGVQVSGVTNMVGLQLAVGQVPDLKGLNWP